MTLSKAIARILSCVIAIGFTLPSAASEIKVGMKSFTESVILGEMAIHLAQEAGIQSVERKKLGGTRILWNALVSGAIDIYPEYTGTISQEILAGKGIHGEEAIRKALHKKGISMSPPLGFNNTYALGMRKETADPLEITTISDLRQYPKFNFGFSNEFMNRADGWGSLKKAYHLPQENVRGLDHDLAYRALASGGIQVTDLYSTDAEIKYYKLLVLDDDAKHFPAYHAVFIYRQELENLHPKLTQLINHMGGKINEQEMIRMNARAKLEKIPENQVAAEFLAEKLKMETQAHEETILGMLLKHTKEHIILVSTSLLPAILLSVILGIWAAQKAKVGQVILATVGIIQTIPALALLVFMMTPLKFIWGPSASIGGPPAVAALFLYSLLPIVRNTYTGLKNISPSILESADVLGLSPSARLRLVELPMASPLILAGIKTAAVINVGFATLGALIGAGGYGQPILTGIRLDNMGLILQGAVPAAVMAIGVQILFELAEKGVVPKGLRKKGAKLPH